MGDRQFGTNPEIASFRVGGDSTVTARARTSLAASRGLNHSFLYETPKEEQ